MELSERQGRGARFLRVLALRNRGFIYPGARLTEGQIRLIKIHPGSWGTKLQCSLQTVRRSSGTSYKALSYTWGDQNAEKKISINGKDFRITANLHDALCRLRERNWSFWLWVDAICINQADTVERNAQVQQMGEIFSEATEVIIWLGDAPNGSCALKDVESLARLGAAATADDIQGTITSLLDVFSSPWFVRLWVLQEVLVARECIIVRGSESCPLATLYPLGRIDKLHATLSANFVIGTPEGEIFSRGFSSFLDVRRWLYATTISQGRDSVDYILYLGLLNKARGRLCQDPRDHIFGLSGIAKSLGVQAIQADYSQPTHEVYRSFMQHMLLREPSMIFYFETAYLDPSPIDLPSWVPDLSVLPELLPFSLHYRAGGINHAFKLAASAFYEERGGLVLAGHRFDRVRAHVEHTRVEFNQRDGDETKEFCLLAEDILRTDPSTNPYKSHMGRHQACWRTLIGNRYTHQKHGEEYWVTVSVPPDDNGEAYEILVGRASAVPQHVNAKENKAVLENLDDLRNRIHSTMTSRRLYITHKGFFCVGPTTAMEGDLILVAPGLYIPVILRKRLTGISYELIGPAYVHGIMDGEFMEMMEESGSSEERFFID